MDFRVDQHLGAQPSADSSKPGTHFAVWAPNAQDVCVICERNGWKHGVDVLKRDDHGVWSGVLADVRPGDTYKFSLRTVDGSVIEKADPVARQSEVRPQTASIVCDLSGFEWNDAEWMTHRRDVDWCRQPVSIYEVHLGSWRRPADGREWFSYRELADQLIDYCGQLGYTHLQLLPVTEHPFDGSWGYQVTAYFSPTSRFGTPHDFMDFVDRCHQAGLGVLIDWVPAHFPNDPHGLAWFDGTALYEHSDPRQGIHPDWDTHIFNFERPEVRAFLLSSAHFWCDHYHVDGIRVDAVASMLYLDYSRDSGQWVPNEHGGRENLHAISLLQELNTTLHAEFPGLLTIAEESTAWPGVTRPADQGGLGFSMKWDMGWMHDTLQYLRRDPIHRRHHQNELSFRAVYADSENFILPLSHDEVVHGKRSLLSQMPGDEWQRFANLRLLYAYQYATPGKKMLFMGGELGQWLEWNHDGQVDWALEDIPRHRNIQKLINALNQLYREHPALHDRDCAADGFQWISADDWEKSTYAFIRWNGSRNECVVVALNFTPVSRDRYRIGAPRAGFYREVFNSDAAEFGGSGLVNSDGIYSDPEPMHGFDNSLSVTLPPLGMIVLQPIRLS